MHVGNSHEGGDDDKKKKKKKRNGSLAFDGDDELDESISFPRRPYSLAVQKIHPHRFDQRERDYDDLLNECPVLDAIDKRCQNVDLISGGGSIGNRFSDALLPACGVHQFCYLCVSIDSLPIHLFAMIYIFPPFHLYRELHKHSVISHFCQKLMQFVHRIVNVNQLLI